MFSIVFPANILTFEYFYSSIKVIMQPMDIDYNQFLSLSIIFEISLATRDTVLQNIGKCGAMVGVW